MNNGEKNETVRQAFWPMNLIKILRVGCLILTTLGLFILFIFIWKPNLVNQMFGGKDGPGRSAVVQVQHLTVPSNSVSKKPVPSCEAVGSDTILKGFVTLLTLLATLFAISQLLGVSTMKDSFQLQIKANGESLQHRQEQVAEAMEKRLMERLESLHKGAQQNMVCKLNRDVPPMVRKLSEEAMLLSADSVQNVVSIHNRNMRALYRRMESLIAECCETIDAESRNSLAGSVIQPIRDALFEQQLLKLLFSDDKVTLRGVLGDIYAHPFPEARERLQILKVRFQDNYNEEILDQIDRALKAVESTMRR